MKIDTLKHSTLPDFLKSSANDDEKCSEKCHCENKYRPSQLSSADVKSAKSKMKLDLSVTKESNARDFKSEVDETNEESCLLDGKQKLPSSLPPPQEFGCGNPFLMFLCLSLLLQYRDRIMTHKMDYNDTAMFFDRMVRRHNARSVVAQARVLYCAYVKCQKELLESKTSWILLLIIQFVYCYVLRFGNAFVILMYIMVLTGHLDSQPFSHYHVNLADLILSFFEYVICCNSVLFFPMFFLIIVLWLEMTEPTLGLIGSLFRNFFFFGGRGEFILLSTNLSSVTLLTEHIVPKGSLLQMRIVKDQ